MSMTASRLPANAQEIMDRRLLFSERLAEAKQGPLPQQLTWYPYDSMASIDHIESFLRGHFADFERAFRAGPVIDFGCGDGTLLRMAQHLGVHNALGLLATEEEVALVRQTGVNVQQGFTDQLPLSDASASVVVCNNVLLIVPRDRIAASLREIWRAIPPAM